MTTVERVVLIYGVSVIGAGLIAWLRGRDGTGIAKDAALHGLVAGTSLNVVGYFVLPAGSSALAKTNSGEATPVYSKDALKVLGKIDMRIFDDFNHDGVKIYDAPENPSIINQEP